MKFKQDLPKNTSIKLSFPTVKDIAPLAPKKVNGGVLFSYPPAEGISSVAVAGIFNSWDGTTDYLQQDSEGIWRLIKKLPAGRQFCCKQ